jgi:hypothetical protein
MLYGIEASPAALRDYGKDFQKNDGKKRTIPGSAASTRRLSTASTLGASERATLDISPTKQPEVSTEPSPDQKQKSRLYKSIVSFLGLR